MTYQYPALRMDEAELAVWKKDWEAKIISAWSDSSVLTPRQAGAFVYILDGWGDGFGENGLEQTMAERHPFDLLDARVTMLIHDNKPWFNKAVERMFAVAREIEDGQLPFDRRGCYFDELLMAMMLRDAPAWSNDFDLLDGLPIYMGPPADVDEDEVEDYRADADWDGVAERFDDEACFGEWEYPIFRDHPMLGHFLTVLPPTKWFDLVQT